MGNQTYKGKHAIVIGGSIAGLLAARVLSDHFEKVTILERDPVQNAPESRKGQPQTRHIHAILAQGLTIFMEYFPGVDDEMHAEGALRGDMGIQAHWFHDGGFRKNFESGLIGMTMSRPFLEFHIRRRTLAIPNITIMDNTPAKELITTPDKQKVLGVVIERRSNGGETENLLADLVLDACGRGSSAPKWLESLGYGRPTETEVKIRVGYATREYRRTETEMGTFFAEMISAASPHEKRGAFIYPIEGNRWILTTGSSQGEAVPSDEASLLEFVRNLPVPTVYNIISKAEPLSGIINYKYPASLRRHYEKMERFPENFLVMGDAVGSMNPIYGQGMTSSAMQSKVLQKLLQELPLSQIRKPYFEKVAQVIDLPWQLTVSEDFRYPETEGAKPPLADLINTYVSKAHRATHHDTVVYKQFLRVMNLMDPPTSLMTPDIFWRVMLKG